MTLSVVFIVVLFLLDKLVVTPCLNHKARYFALHAVANAISATAAFPDVYRLMSDPLTAFSGPSYTMVANRSVCN